jgi:hypothetical protein
MKTDIGPEVDLALRKQIERAVRPVQAGKDRKLAMREELLAHLTTIYAEERERQPDDQVAMAAALERFGEPVALTAELNASVNLSQKNAYYIDRWEDEFNRGLHYWFSRREGESWLHLALRSLCALVLFNLIIFVSIPLVCVLFYGGPGDPQTLSQLPILFLLFVVSQAATIAATRHMLHTLEGTSGSSRWIWICVQALLWSLFSAAFTVPFRWSLGGSLPVVKEVADVAFSFAVGLPPFFVFGVWCIDHAKRFRKQLELWTKLTIDE